MEQYETVIKEYRILAELYALVKQFHKIIFSHKEDELETWIAKAKEYNIPELDSFPEGTCKDIEVVKMA